ncbi:hypothetical protein CASFOL_005115 [Castilleja foliolosa]|uniref:F-box associated beta-propeller type 1 domain-containing protein n=1 Tax=Castilleja foliolosa TaxID=1961234 RepID=A0ABD3E4J6_9LAMI
MAQFAFLPTLHQIPHLAFQNTRHKSLILIPPSQVICCVENIRAEHDGTVSRELGLPGLWSRFLGSCDGLVFLINKDAEVFLVNPITMEQSKIPDPPVPVVRNEVLYLFGYDSVVDDYKVVAVFYLMPDDEIDPVPIYIDTLVYVYYVKRGVWKKIENSPRHYSLPAYFSGTFLNGAIHWLGSKSEDCAVIAALDLDNEVFFEIPAPSIADLNNILFGVLLVLGGCLCVVDTLSNREGTDVWIMKDYGVVDSWRKFTVSVHCFADLFMPLCFIGDGEDELLLLVEGPRLVVYNVKEGTLKDMVVDRVPGKFEDGGTFVGSLVSPA